MPDAFHDFVAEEAMTLATLDPGAPLDDLEPLAARLAGAKVVAIGENSHLVREFGLLRHRLTRFLVERLGFTLYGLESGFSEGLTVDDWVRGGPGDLRTIADVGITYTFGRCAEMRAHLEWMRKTNAAGTKQVRFFGIDVPGSTASPLPAMHNIRRYLSAVDGDGAAVVDRLVTLLEKFAGEHPLPAYAAYGQLAAAERDGITALFAELATRFDALGPEYVSAGGVESYEVARHELRLACLLDQSTRSVAARMAGDTSHPKVAARDRGMAETVFWLLDRFGPDARIVIAAHNSHIQRTPVVTPAFSLSAMGHHLANRLGGDYVSMAVTGTAGRTVTRRANPDRPGGVEIVGVDLDPAREGSVEAAFAAVPGLRAVDLRGARGRLTGPDHIRVMDTYQEVQLLDAYDLVVNVPETSTTEQLAG
ncbi:erythromycin esterase family protein [Plantactinospora sp. S1510]|uniref:Erythromycin esterase family protein n=1 Tax=Plantactinospora alkalitolerans TaxID=2789879 RepID=A0ABS0H4B7_9ACTN|nr:erythromycin esterase family protein [Plantactinospora alkalitolerans]MBF9133058.1 erythromycin esterase family protein [Plantactinospora alkalitolerans]